MLNQYILYSVQWVFVFAFAVSCFAVSVNVGQIYMRLGKWNPKITRFRVNRHTIQSFYRVFIYCCLVLCSVIKYKWISVIRPVRLPGHKLCGPQFGWIFFRLAIQFIQRKGLAIHIVIWMTIIKIDSSILHQLTCNFTHSFKSHCFQIVSSLLFINQSSIRNGRTLPIGSIIFINFVFSNWQWCFKYRNWPS